MAQNRSEPSVTEPETEPEEAIVICTRNRTEDFGNTLRSVASCLSEEPGCDRQSSRWLLLVVDASDGDAVRRRHRSLCENLRPLVRVRYCPYSGNPSLPRQRNYAAERIPPAVEAVHFIDDDVSIEAGYFQRLARVLAAHPEVGGVGGLVLQPGSSPDRPDATFASAMRARLGRLFLISSKTPGRILASGGSSPPQLPSSYETLPRALRKTEWLGGCATYRRAVLDQYRFDSGLDGVAPFEDRDFSYRVGTVWQLVVEPRAQLVHHASPVERLQRAAHAREHFVHHYWFTAKNVRHPLRKLAFWWAALGRLVARVTSADPHSSEALEGLASGIQTVLRGDHPMLESLSKS